MKFALATLFLILLPPQFFAQSKSRQSGAPQVCVAVVANAGTVSADREHLTERLVKLIKRNKLEAVTMDSSTTMQPRLMPTRQNSDEAEDKHCDYTLLTQIIDIRANPGVPQTTSPRPGASVPSIDASDPLGGQSGPVYREELEIAFALFRPSHYDPIVDTYVLERASANVSDSFLSGMDRIATRVAHELKKK